MDSAASAATLQEQWFELIRKNAQKEVAPEDAEELAKFIETHKKDFENKNIELNPLFWKDLGGNNALHLLLAAPEIDGEKGSPLFQLLMFNAQFKGKEDALLQRNTADNSAFKIGVRNSKIKKKNGLLGTRLSGDAYLTSDDGKFLKQSSTKVDDFGNSLLHIMALCKTASLESFLELQKIMDTNMRAKDADFRLKFLMSQRNEAQRTPLEVALLSKNFYLANKLLKSAVKHKKGFEEFEIDERNHSGERLLDLMFVKNDSGESGFKIFNIQNFAIYQLEKQDAKLTEKDWNDLGKLPRHYGENLRLFKKFLQRLIENTQDLGPNLRMNPINECLKIGLFDEALELIKRSDEATLKFKDSDDKNVMQTIVQAKNDLEGFIKGKASIETKYREYFSKIFTDLQNAAGRIFNREFIKIAEAENVMGLRTEKSDKPSKKKADSSGAAISAEAAAARRAAPESNQYQVLAVASASLPPASSARHDGTGGHNFEDYPEPESHLTSPLPPTSARASRTQSLGASSSNTAGGGASRGGGSRSRTPPTATINFPTTDSDGEEFV